MTFECKVCGPLLDVDLNDDVELREDGYCKSHSWIFERYDNFKLKKYPDGGRAHSISTNCGYCNNEISGNFVNFDDFISPQVMSNEEFSNKFIEYIRDHLTEDFQIPDNLSDMDYEFLWEVIQSICPTSPGMRSYYASKDGTMAPVKAEDLNRFFDAYGNELVWTAQFRILTQQDTWRDYRLKFNFISPQALRRNSKFMEEFKQRISEYNFSQPREKWSRDQLEFYFALWFFTKFVVKAKGPGERPHLRFPLLYITPPFIYIDLPPEAKSKRNTTHAEIKILNEIEYLANAKWFLYKPELPKLTSSEISTSDPNIDEQLRPFPFHRKLGAGYQVLDYAPFRFRFNSGIIHNNFWHTPTERFDLVTYAPVDFSYIHPVLAFETRGVGNREIGDTLEYRKVTVKRKINIQFNKMSFYFDLRRIIRISKPNPSYELFWWRPENGGTGLANPVNYQDLWKVQIYPDDWPLRWSCDDKYHYIDFEPINHSGKNSWTGVVKFHDATFKTGVDTDKTLGKIVCKKCLKNEGQKSPNKKKSAKPQEKHTPHYDDDEDYDDEDEGVNNNSGGRRRFGPGYS